MLLAQGRGVARDDAAAVLWYQLAAGQGDAAAQLNLGVLHGNGQGVAQDYAEAVKWYRLAAAQGNDVAQTNLGSRYGNGQGVARDYARAHMWFSLGAEAGNADAAQRLSLVAKLMSPAQIADARRLAIECQARKLKGCD